MTRIPNDDNITPTIFLKQLYSIEKKLLNKKTTETQKNEICHEQPFRQLMIMILIRIT